MTDASNLNTEAAAISKSSSLIRAFAIDAAANLTLQQSQIVALQKAVAALAPPVSVPASAQPRPFLPGSKINTPIPANPPIHPDSAAMIQSPDWIIPAGDPAYPYREWIGPRGDASYSRVNPATPAITIHVNYDDVLGYGIDRHIAQMPMPAALQAAYKITYGQPGGLQNNNGYGWSVDADGNVWEVCYLTGPGQPPFSWIDPVTKQKVAPNSNQWNALRCDYWGAGGKGLEGNENAGNGYGTTYPCSASHISVGAGQIRPEEIGAATGSSTLGHVLKIKGNLGADGNTAGHPKSVGPAFNGDGRIAGSRGIPYGARLQLDPSIDVAAWPSVVAKNMPGLVQILKTLQVYGAIVVDSGGWARASGGLDVVDPACWPAPAPWDKGFGWSYDNGVPYDLMPRFRVIDWNRWT